MKLDRKILRKLILQEMHHMHEQEGAVDAMIDANKENLAQLTSAYETGGVSGFFDEAVRMGVISGKQVWKLATNDALQQEFLDKLENEGVEAAYVLWVEKLSKKVSK